MNNPTAGQIIMSLFERLQIEKTQLNSLSNEMISTSRQKPFCHYLSISSLILDTKTQEVEGNEMICLSHEIYFMSAKILSFSSSFPSAFLQLCSQFLNINFATYTILSCEYECLYIMLLHVHFNIESLANSEYNLTSIGKTWRRRRRSNWSFLENDGISFPASSWCMFFLLYEVSRFLSWFLLLKN